MATEIEKITNLTKRMVEIPSVTGKYAEAVTVLDLVNSFLKGSPELISRSFESVNKETGEKFVSRLWGSNNSLLEPKLLLSGHIDVVQAESKFFQPVEKDGRLYGRGAGDMKGHAAAMIVAYKNWITEHGNSDEVGLLLTSDEEVGGFNGARYVVENGGMRPSVVFIPDGEFSFDIVDSQKAPHHFHVRALSTTKGGHVSRAFELDNPVNRILLVYAEMRKKYALATKDDEWKSTFEMTIFNTGNGEDEDRVINSANQIPQIADAWFGWRWPLEVEIGGQKPTFESGERNLKRIAKKYGVEILADGHGLGEGCYTNPEAPFVKKWKGIIEEIIDKKVGFRHMHGATDGRHFAKFGAKVLVTSAVTEGAHSNNEWVNIESLAQLAEAVYAYQQEITK